jgi:hypothetical protein
VQVQLSQRQSVTRPNAPDSGASSSTPPSPVLLCSLQAWAPSVPTHTVDSWYTLFSKFGHCKRIIKFIKCKFPSLYHDRFSCHFFKIKICVCLFVCLFVFVQSYAAGQTKILVQFGSSNEATAAKNVSFAFFIVFSFFLFIYFYL